MQNNYSVQYVDAHTGEVLKINEFHDPGPWDPKLGKEVPIHWAYGIDVGWIVLNAYGCGRPMDWWLKENKHQ